MQAVSRVVKAWAAMAIALAPAIALAQAAPDTPPPSDTVGPRDLQNFTLNGTVTHPADQPPSTTKTRERPKAPAPARTQAPTAEPTHETAPSSATAPPAVARTPEPRNVPSTAPAPVSRRPETIAPEQPTYVPPPVPQAAAPPAVSPPGPAASASAGFGILPWLLAAVALAGGLFLFWRSRRREAASEGPPIDLFDARPLTAPAPAPREPEPAPPPPIAEAPPRPAPPANGGVVSSSLRPWIDIICRPLRAVLQDEQLTIEFELELFNSGSAPARNVQVEAGLFNAGATQDQELGTFFDRPPSGAGNSVAIAPLSNIIVRSEVAVSRAELQSFEVAGRQLAIPLIGVNAFYNWGSGAGQSSGAYLLGRENETDKLAPLRLDLGNRIFRGLGARILGTGVRR